MTARTINIRAVPTLGSNSRVARLQFHPVDTFVSGSGWDDYTMPSINVSTNTLLRLSSDSAHNAKLYKAHALQIKQRNITNDWRGFDLPQQSGLLINKKNGTAIGLQSYFNRLSMNINVFITFNQII